MYESKKKPNRLLGIFRQWKSVYRITCSVRDQSKHIFSFELSLRLFFSFFEEHVQLQYTLHTHTVWLAAWVNGVLMEDSVIMSDSIDDYVIAYIIIESFAIMKATKKKLV